MNLRRVLFAFAVVGCMSASPVAQTSSRVVKVQPAETVYRVKQGAAVEAGVVVEIDHGYHINSNRPAQSFLIPTMLKLQPIRGLTTGRVIYPKAKLQKFSFSEKPMSVYEGKAVLKFNARALPTLAAGKHTLKGKLRVQACNDQQCLRPQTIDVEIPFELTK